MASPTNEHIAAVLTAIDRITPEAPSLTALEAGRPAHRRPLLVAASAFVAVLLAVGVVALLPIGRTHVATTPDAACQPTTSGETSGEVAGIPWSVSITGQPPNVSGTVYIDGRPAGGWETDAESWENHLKGSWEWSYVVGDAAVLFGKIPLDSSARVTLDNGAIVPLCPVGLSLGHGVAYAAGAFPRSVAIRTVQIVDADSTPLGSAPLAQLLDFAHLQEAQKDFSLGFDVVIPPDQSDNG